MVIYILGMKIIKSGYKSNRMKDAHTDIAIVAGGLTAPLWVNALTGWFALGSAGIAFGIGCYRVYQIYRGR